MSKRHLPCLPVLGWYSLVCALSILYQMLPVITINLSLFFIGNIWNPKLFVSGDTRHWMLSIEGQVVCEGTTFVSGLAVLFASYYNFNLQYQDEAACTLEFIQRSAALTLSPTYRWYYFHVACFMHDSQEIHLWIPCLFSGGSVTFSWEAAMCSNSHQVASVSRRTYNIQYCSKL